MKTHMELKNKTFIMRANINSDCIRALKRWNKESGKKIAEAINAGNVKAAIDEYSNAKARNRQVRELSAEHDKIIYDEKGESIAIWDNSTNKCFKLIG